MGLLGWSGMGVWKDVCLYTVENRDVHGSELFASLMACTIENRCAWLFR